MKTTHTVSSFCHWIVWRFSQSSQRNGTSFGDVLKTLEDFRELETQLTFFNLVFARVLWLLKLMCLIMGILGVFSAIRISHRNPLLASIYALASVDCIILYTAMFTLAHGVTEKTEELRRVIELTSCRLSDHHHRKYCDRMLRSIPLLAMCVGGFHTIERDSVPKFVDFVFKQIVGLLLL